MIEVWKTSLSSLIVLESDAKPTLQGYPLPPGSTGIRGKDNVSGLAERVIMHLILWQKEQRVCYTIKQGRKLRQGTVR